MEMKTSTVVAALVAAMMLVQTLAIPLGQDAQANPANLPAEKRPKYMDTRDLSYFKQYLLESVSELIQEGVLSPSVLEKPRPDEQEQEITARKRGHLGLCFRLTPSGNPAARPCWIEDETDLECKTMGLTINEHIRAIYRMSFFKLTRLKMYSDETKSTQSKKTVHFI